MAQGLLPRAATRKRATRKSLQKRKEAREKKGKVRKRDEKSGAKVCKSCRTRKILQNEYLVAKIGVDTADNELSKVDILIF